MKKAASIIVILCITSAVARAAKEEEANEINLVVGGQKVIPAQGVQSFSEGAPGIVQVKVPEDGKRLVVTALRPGSTTLLLIYSSGKQETIYLNVYARAPAAIRAEL